MLSGLGGMLSRFKETKLVQNITDNYKKIRKQMSKKLQLIEIIPNVYHISYPEDQTIKELKQHIADSDFQIWNISQYKYKPSIEAKLLEKSQNGEIHHLCYEYYSNLPLYQLIIAINSIHYFLSLSQTHKVYIHCQDNKIRSSVFLVCFIYKFKSLNLQEVSQAIFYVNQKLKVNIEVEEQKESEAANYNNFHTFFKNYINYINSPQMLNKNRLELLKIMINDAPKLKIPKETTTDDISLKELKVIIEIRCKDQIITKGSFNSTVFEGESICIDLSHRTIILGDDFVVIIKYALRGTVYSMMRIQLNTNFVFQKFFRAHQQYIDLSSFCKVPKGNTMFIDFLFQQNLEFSDLAKLQQMPQEKVRKVHKKHQIKEDNLKKLKEEKKQEPVEASQDRFQLHDQDHEVDEHEINLKIEEVLKNMSLRQAEAEEDRKNEEEEKEEEEKQEQEEDLDDYLSKLESQAS